MDYSSTARAFAAKGWHVFPVKGKEPLVRWREPYQTLGGRWADATGLGVGCGESGLVVVDIDAPDAQTELERMLGRTLDSYETLTASTGKGTHFYFAAHGDPVTNARGAIPHGIDIRGDGGYVVLPPSQHPDGGTYRWTRRADPQPLPDELRALCTAAPDATPPAEHTGPAGTLDPWTRRAVEDETAAVRGTTQGGRNHRLFRAALKLYSIEDTRLTDSQATDELMAAALAVGLDREEAERTLASARERATQTRQPVAAPIQAPVLGQQQPEQHGQVAGFTSLDVDALADMPEPEWLLPGRLPKGQTWLFGEPGVGKSFLQADWGLALAAQGGKVLSFLGEGVAGFAQRVTAWRSAHPGQDVSGYRVVPTVPYLLQPTSVEALVATVRELQPDLIILDTFARCLVGGDENSSQHVGQAIDVLDQLWRTWGTSSLVVHHSKKNGDGERGSGAIRGAADAMWEVKRYGGGELDSMEVKCQKMKDAEPPSPWLHQLRQASPSAVLYPSALA